jgi:two-component system LytT family response regulator
MLERDSRVEIVARCASGAETLRVIHDAEKPFHPVHILLLDVQMPEMNGFEVVAELMGDGTAATGRPLIVFVTAYDEYALRAFESHAIFTGLPRGCRFRAAVRRPPQLSDGSGKRA